MIIDDGIIVYLDGKLQKLSYLQIVAITFFASILSEADRRAGTIN